MPSHPLFDDVLRPLLRTPPTAAAHLAYTPEFEAACARLKPGATVEEKHGLWERFLELRYKTELEVPAENRSWQPPGPQPREGNQKPVEASLPSFPTSLFEANSPARSTRGVITDAVTSSPAVIAGASQAKAFRDLDAKREELLADIADSRFGTIEQRLAQILQRFPETRESYIALSIRYWKQFQPDVLEKWDPLELEVLFELETIETLNRQRRFIQNDLKLFRGLEDIKQYRMLYQEQLVQYIQSHRGTPPEIRFYLDETGNEADKAYCGVGGVCVANWRQYEKHAAALSHWRAKQAWPEPIHFVETGTSRLDLAVNLLGQLEGRRGGLLFLGYSMQSRSAPRDSIYTLFVHLILDSLRRLDDLRALSEPRIVRIIKEAEAGFDELYLPMMEKQLSELTDLEFKGRIGIQPIETMTKGGHVLLECADLVAGAMQRRALFNKRNPKDRLADAVFNVTGFNSDDIGAVFQYFGK